MILIITELILISILSYQLYRLIQRYREISPIAYPHTLDRLRQALHSVFGNGRFLDIVMFEINIVYYTLGSFYIKARPKLSNMYTFSYDKTSQFKTIAIVFGIIIVAESVLIHIILEQFLLSRYDQSWMLILPWLVHVLNIYVIMFFIAQNKAMHDLPHYVTDGNLIVHNGILGAVSIPIIHITSVQKAKALGLGDKTDPWTFYAYNKIDSPHYEITLAEPAVCIGSYGKKQNVNKIVTRVDDPQSFLITLNKLRGGQSS